jgi:hypothetical protein
MIELLLEAAVPGVVELGDIRSVDELLQLR